MAPLCNIGKDLKSVKSEKPDFSSIINFIGGDIRRDKKRRRGDAEKKRRDRINRCLDQLEELIPYVRQKKLCSKVDKAEVLELTVHFVKETLYERELQYRKSHMTSLMEYERLKISAHESHERRVINEKCKCGCGSSNGKRSHSTEPPISPYSPPSKVQVVRSRQY